jgi:hypothetical protein
LREYSIPQVEEFAERLDRLDWSPGTDVVLASQPSDVQQYIANELLLCPLDFRYWAERYAVISHDAGRLSKFSLRRAQQAVLDKFAELEDSTYPLKQGKLAVIVVKTRRAGLTAFGQTAAAHGYLLRPQAKALVGSDTPKGTLELNHIQNRILENLPAWMRPKQDGRVKGEHARFPGLDSELTYTFGDAKTPIQGVRQDFIHLTEVPTWAFIHTITEDIMPAFLSSNVPTSFMLLEGTGKSDIGSGVMYQRMYQQAAENKGIFRPLFLGWYAIPEIHSMPSAGITLSEAALSVAARIKRDTGYECTKDQLAWYTATREQFEAEKRLQTFLQEYPTSAEEAWQTGFNSVISLETRDRIRQQVLSPAVVMKWNEDIKDLENADSWKSGDSPLQHLFIYQPAVAGATYVIGVDGAHGDPEYDSEDWIKGEKDPSAVVALRVGVPGVKPEQVATWTGYIHPTDLSKIAEFLGKMFHDKTNDKYPAMMACEVNAGSPSAITQMELLKRRYPHFYIWPKPNRVGGGYTTSIGWETTPKSRSWITSGLVKDIESGDLIINSLVSLEQMKTFVKMRTESGQTRLDHAPGYHDDELFATGIALYCSQDPAAVNMAKQAWRSVSHTPKAKPQINYQATGMILVDGELVVITPGFVRGDDPAEYTYPIPS